MTEREVYNAVKSALEAKKIKEDPFEVIKLISEQYQHLEPSASKRKDSVLIRFGERKEDLFRGLFRIKPETKEIEGELLILDYIKDGVVRVI
ncbi:hypothetical protein ABB02_00120 [Clostridiaceae bacterium JG1575]|nr:hypothetical protein ABB02_00120 [Clostridiaceae bacterium JG1575]